MRGGTDRRRAGARGPRRPDTGILASPLYKVQTEARNVTWANIDVDGPQQLQLGCGISGEI